MVGVALYSWVERCSVMREMSYGRKKMVMSHSTNVRTSALLLQSLRFEQVHKFESYFHLVFVSWCVVAKYLASVPSF